MIWLFGGGIKSHELNVFLKQLGISYKLSTVREYNRDMPLSYASKALCILPTEEEIQDTVLKEGIHLIIDHTYGELTKFSKTLLIVCERLNIQYVRYEIPGILDKLPDIIAVDELSEITDVLKMTPGNIFIRLNRKAQKNLDGIGLDKKIYSYHMPHCIINYEEIKEELNANNFLEQLKYYSISCIILHEQDEDYIQMCQTTNIDLIVLRKKHPKYTNRFCELQQLKDYLYKSV